MAETKAEAGVAEADDVELVVRTQSPDSASPPDTAAALLPSSPVRMQSPDSASPPDTAAALLPAAPRRCKVAYFWIFLARSAYHPYIAVYGQHLGLTPVQIGVLKGIVPVCSLLAAPLWARYADTKSKHRCVLLTTMVLGTLLQCLQVSANAVDSLSSRFVLLMFLIGLSEAVASPSVSLIDSAVLNVLTARGVVGDYGWYRLWGAVGWGAGALFVGAVIDAVSSINVMFVLLAVGMVFATWSAAVLPISKTKLKGSWSSTVWRVISHPPLFRFLFLALLLGVLAGVVAVYLFLFLDDLGASRTLLGASLAVTCAAEAPMFALSGFFLRKLGSLRVVALAFFCFFLRLSYYSILPSLPSLWWVLPAELLHGVTFGLAWAACQLFVKEFSPAGLSSTMPALLSAVKMGLGIGLGAVVGGVIYSRYSPIVLFRAAAVLAIVGMVGTLVMARAEGLAGRRDARAPRVELTRLGRESPAVVDVGTLVSDGGEEGGGVGERPDGGDGVAL